MTLVSAIITTHNRSALLKQAIESVLAADHDDSELEIIVVDDGSTDDTSEVVKNYPVIYLPQSGGLGPSGARNVGVAAARGEYIAFLDDDDVWLPTKLAAHLRFFREHPEYEMVIAQMWHCDSNLEQRFELYPPDMQQLRLSATDLLRLDPQVGAVMVKRPVAQKIPFDSSLRRMEDWDWFLRVAQRALVGYINVPVMLLRGRSRNFQERWLFYRSVVKIFRRNTRAFTLSSRLRMQPILWKWRGKFTWYYVEDARLHLQNHHYLQSAKAMGYALRVSSPHVAVVLARFAWAKLAQLRCAPAPL